MEATTVNAPLDTQAMEKFVKVISCAHNLHVLAIHPSYYSQCFLMLEDQKDRSLVKVGPT